MKSFLRRVLAKFYYAFCGLSHGIRHDHSIRLQCALGIVTLIVFAFLPMQPLEWMLVVLLIGLVITMEFVNSAVEQIVDMISPQYHPKAKLIKDGMAAAVLVTSLTAAVIALILIGGKLL